MEGLKEKMIIGKKKYCFLLKAIYPCGNLRTILKAFPDCEQVEISDGDLIYYFDVSSESVENALDEAIAFCVDIGIKSGIEWIFDDEFTISERNQVETIGLYSDDLLGSKIKKTGLY